MAKVNNTPEVVVAITDSIERTVHFSMSNDQVYDALFTWLRINKVELPSENQDDYRLTFNFTNYNSESEVKFYYKKEL